LASAPALAQATRIWASGVGDDANPCSRTAPCKTFAGAISKTAVNGEINCLDPAGYGAVTIVKSITIDCTGTFGSILASGASFGVGINITDAADSLKTVRLRGLSINGTGFGSQSGIHGVSILAAMAVYIEDVVISDFTQNGIRDARSTRGRFYVRNSVIRNNRGVGILAAATGSGTGLNSIDNVHSINNNFGVAVGAGNNVKIIRSVFSGNSTAGIEADAGAQLGWEALPSAKTASACKPMERYSFPIRISLSIVPQSLEQSLHSVTIASMATASPAPLRPLAQPLPITGSSKSHSYHSGGAIFAGVSVNRTPEGGGNRFDSIAGGKFALSLVLGSYFLYTE
jgi:hypothetical protein